MKILYKFPSRSRPIKFFKTLDNIISKASHDDYHILCTLDLDDETMNDRLVTDRLDKYHKVSYVYGNNTGKIDAINADMDLMTDWDICVVMSDDMVIKRAGFDLEIIRAFETYFPDTDGIVHFKDGPYGERLMGLNVQGRKFYERFGWLYCPEYKSLWCDNEQMDTGKMLGKYVYIGDTPQWIEHCHPAHVPGLEYDDLLRKTESYYREDEQTYLRRKARNFDLPIQGL